METALEVSHGRGRRRERSGFSPGTSTSSTLSAESSPERSYPAKLSSGSVPHDMTVNESGKDSISNMDEYTIGQLSYAPATRTTVVTTTTTTTTTMPPVFLKPPQHLHDRDPKLYPLAISPTPAAIKKFKFDLSGRPTEFVEAEDTPQALQKFRKQYSDLQASNGTLRSVTNLDKPSKTPERLLSSTKSAKMPQLGSTGSRKRQASPVSISEAAELASLQRRTKKQRPSDGVTESSASGSRRLKPSHSRRHVASLDDGAPTTPDTDTGELSKPKNTTSKLKPKRQAVSSSNVSEGRARGRDHARSGQQSENQNAGSSSKATPMFPSLPQLSATEGYLDLGIGVSATPPIAETDLEPSTAQDPRIEALRIRRPAPLDTSSVNDASLPSPSLSPITAAATLSNVSSLHQSVTEDDHEDGNASQVSSLDLCQDSFEDLQTRRAQRQALRHNATNIEIPAPGELVNANPQLPTPTLMDIPNMLDSFDSMPSEMQSYVMFHLLRRCAKPTLHFVADVVNPALKCDFLGLLPLELSVHIVRYLDAQSMCRAAQVSKKWRHIVDSDEKAWSTLLDTDGFKLPDGEMEQAIREGWGRQSPYGHYNWERDLRNLSQASKSDCDSSPKSSPSSYGYGDVETINPSSGRPKRKAAAKFSSSKKQRKKGPSSSKTLSPAWMQTLSEAQGPVMFANAAALAVPNPTVGLPTLRNLHLFKSLYQRHHLIRKSWMQDDTKPRHVAFRAHGRHVVTCLQFDTDKIITGSDDTNIHVYGTKTGAKRCTLEGHEGGVWALQYEGNILVSGSTDRSVRVWDIDKGRCLQVFQGHTSTVRCLVILTPTEIGKDADGTPIMMPKEPLVITGSRDSSLRVWRLPSVDDPSLFESNPPVHDHDNPYFVRALVGHHHSVRAIAAHGDTLISGSYDCSVRVWKISTGNTLHRLQGHTQKVYSVVLDHARNRCISGSMDNLVKVWSLDSGACLFNLEGHSSLVGLLDLSHGRLVSAAADSTLRIWDPENGQCKSTLSAHTGAITCFQHDSQKVISGSDRTLKMWNVKSGDCVKDLLTDLSGVWQVKFNDRRCVAAVQRNNFTYIEVLDFGAARDGVPPEQTGRRIVVDQDGNESNEADDTADHILL